MGQPSIASAYVKKTVVVIAAMVGVSSLALAQTSDEQKALDYAALLQQISDLETTIAHQQVYIGTQEAEIASLQEQIDQTQGVVDSVEPMLEKMKVAIDAEIKSDLPFNSAERFNRLGGLEEILAAEDARPVDKMRRALSIYEAEVSYGQTVQSYEGNHPVEARVGERLAACQEDALSGLCALTKSQRERFEKGEATIDDMAGELKDGNYLRYGRLSLAYMQADGSEVWRYDPNTGGDQNWVELSGNKALDVRRAVKMAKGEAAPTVVQAPVYVTVE